jgi:hypothetical protein
MINKKIPILILVGFMVLASCLGLKRGPSIIIFKDASTLEELASKEIQRYLYLRTGNLLSIEETVNWNRVKGPAVIIAQKDRLSAAEFATAELNQKIAGLLEQNYILKTISWKGKPILLIAGGDGTGTLYGAYRLAEKMDVRFYLHGDVIPDQLTDLKIPDVAEEGKPLFRLRGIHPFHDFPEGPDWWNADDYKAVLAQLPKLRMNFFGLHTYPEGGPNAEPTVWIGVAEDSLPDGTVRTSYPSSYQNTLRGNWGYEATKTGDFHFGAADLFADDDFGAEVMSGLMPEPKTPEDSNLVFNRAAAMLRDAFTFGRALGIRTCVGTEMPLTVPEPVKKRLLDLGQNPTDPNTIKSLYKGLFTRIKNAYPLDYYWLWTDENWTWSDAGEAQIKAVVDDALTAIEAANEVQAPFDLATCGWVLGPPSDRTLFDRVLPKHVAASCINREVGKAPVDPMFSRISGRSKWAIPWLEDDPALTSPQLWAGRMRKDAVDALAYGCDGLLGIHWRTRILAPNISALAQAAWDQKPWGNSLSPVESEGPINGVYVSSPQSSIAGTAEEPIYRDIRDRVYGYHLTVPNGNYNLTLKFCEGEIKEKNRRVFDISVQGKKVLEKLDIFAQVGSDRALDRLFKNIAAENGRLDIEFADRIHYPCIAGIVIEGKEFSRKINCGGGAYQDYEADWPETPRYAPTLDFYEDWAAHQFGQDVAAEAAAIFARIDGHLPQPNVWTGPGGLKPDLRPWEEVQKEYRFVDELASLEPRIAGQGSTERFIYWLDSFMYMREMAHLECLWAEYDKAKEAVKSQADEMAGADLAARTLLPIRERLVTTVKALYGYLLATVSNPGEMGTIANWEQHLLPAILLKPGVELQKILKQELLASAQLSNSYDGPPRVIVPTVRTLLAPGEALSLRVMILASGQPAEAALYWRGMGTGRYAAVPLQKIARGVYRVTCPDTSGDLEYYIKVRFNAEEIFFPATAPRTNQTVIRTP